MTEGSGESTAPLVLVGDDEAMVRDLVCEVLGQAGYRTLTASDGEEVVELALRHQPVLIAVDVMMPRWTATRRSPACGASPDGR